MAASPEKHMLAAAAAAPHPSIVARALPAGPEARADRGAAARIADTLKLVEDLLQPQRRIVHAGESIYAAGGGFQCLYLLNSGFAKVVTTAADGREQVVGFKFRGDWLGFDGIARGRYACDAIATDVSEVWVVRYDDFLAACVTCPALLAAMHEAMSREIGRDRDSLMSVCTLAADARVAEFLRYWADALEVRGLRSDQITLRMTRAEIGNYLGLTLETVSRALSRLARESVIVFAERGRRDITIPDVDALSAFVQRNQRSTLQ
jgi:CRP/FNR family transcriptional regulator